MTRSGWIPSSSTSLRRSSRETATTMSQRRAITWRSMKRRWAPPSNDHVCSWATMTGTPASGPSSAAHRFDPNLCACRMSIRSRRMSTKSCRHDRRPRACLRSRPTNLTPCSERSSSALARVGRDSSSGPQRVAQRLLSKRSGDSRLEISTARRSPPPNEPILSTRVRWRSFRSFAVPLIRRSYSGPSHAPPTAFVRSADGRPAERTEARGYPIDFRVKAPVSRMASGLAGIPPGVVRLGRATRPRLLRALPRRRRRGLAQRRDRGSGVAGQPPGGGGRAAGAWLHRYTFPHTFPLRPPWVSAMAQGEGASLLVRIYQETSEERFAEAAMKRHADR